MNEDMMHDTEPPLAEGQLLPEGALEDDQSDDEQEFWKSIKQASLKGKIDRYVDGAKQIISLNSALLGLYFAAISISSIGDYIKIESLRDLPLLLLFMSPALCWCIGLIFALLSIEPPPEGWVMESQSIKMQWKNECNKMEKCLWNARRVTFLGLALMISAVFLYLICMCKVFDLLAKII